MSKTFYLHYYHFPECIREIWEETHGKAEDI